MAAKTSPSAVIYVRISKDRTEQTSLESQEAEARAYCDRQGWRVISVIPDRGRSAYSGKRRPGLDKAIKLIESNTADVLVVWKLDRFARGIVTFWHEWERIDQAGGQFASVTDNLDTSTAAGKMMMGLIAGFAEMESEVKRDRAASWQAHRRSERLAPTGPAPFGYRRVNGTIVVDNDEAAEVRRMVSWLLDDGGSLIGLQRDLDERGVSTRRAGKWSRRTITGLLKSPTLAGLISDNDVLLEGEWEPILSRDRWEAVGTLLDDPARRTGNTNVPRPWLLRGLIQCGRCGDEMAPRARGVGRPTRYLCIDCGAGIDAGSTDELVETALLEMVDGDAWQRLRAEGAPRVDLTTLESDLDTLAGMYARGEIELSEWRTMREGVAARIAAADTEVVELPDVVDLAASWQEMTGEARALVAQRVIEAVTINPTAVQSPKFKPERLSIVWRV